MAAMKRGTGRESTPERRIADLSPEQIERIAAAKKRRAAIHPSYEDMTLEEFINWHPVGGMSWEERAQRMSERLRENKIILLDGAIELSCETARWFAGFLDGSISSNVHKTDRKTYKAEKDTSGNVTFIEIIEIGEGVFTCDLAFSPEEIPGVLTGLRGKLQEYSENDPDLAIPK
jgi:hypothetical protein